MNSGATVNEGSRSIAEVQAEEIGGSYSVSASEKRPRPKVRYGGETSVIGRARVKVVPIPFCLLKTGRSGGPADASAIQIGRPSCMAGCGRQDSVTTGSYQAPELSGSNSTANL